MKKWILISFLFIGSAMPATGAEPVELIALREKYEQAKSQAEEPINALYLSYIKRLDQLKEKPGNLAISTKCLRSIRKQKHYQMEKIRSARNILG